MNIEGKRLPLIRYGEATSLDVWRMADGVGITLSDDDGRVFAGCQITLTEWKEVVAYITNQFSEPDTSDIPETSAEFWQEAMLIEPDKE